jgi:hypothetical protein
MNTRKYLKLSPNIYINKINAMFSIKINSNNYITNGKKNDHDISKIIKYTCIVFIQNRFRIK